MNSLECINKIETYLSAIEDLSRIIQDISLSPTIKKKMANEELNQLKSNLSEEVRMLEYLDRLGKLSHEGKYLLLPTLKHVKAFLKIKSNSIPNDFWNDALYTAHSEFTWRIFDWEKSGENF